MKTKKKGKKYIYILFGIYMMALILVIVLKFPTKLGIQSIKMWLSGGEIIRLNPQLKPMKTIITYIHYTQAWYDWFFKNLMCNIIMFLPYGILVPLMDSEKKRGMLFVVLSGALLSLFIEILQWVTAFGHFDVDDIILNTLGIAIGYEIYRVVSAILLSRKLSRKK